MSHCIMSHLSVAHIPEPNRAAIVCE